MQTLYTARTGPRRITGENNGMDFIGRWHKRAAEAFKVAKATAKDNGGRLTLEMLAKRYNDQVDKDYPKDPDAARMNYRTAAQFNHWFRGRRDPRLSELDRLCRVMNWPPELILFGFVFNSEITTATLHVKPSERHPVVDLPRKKTAARTR